MGRMLRIAVMLSLAAAISHAAVSHVPIRVGQTFVASGLDPKDGSTPWSLVSHGIAEKLFTVSKTGEVVPQIGQSVTKVDMHTWRVTLTTGYKFSDGTVVTADHVVTALRTQNTQNSNGNDALGAMNVTKVDDATVQIVSEMAHPAVDAALANWVFVIFLEKDGGYLFTGPFAVEALVAGNEIKLVPNQHYPDNDWGRPLVTIKKYANGDALADAVAAGELDLAFHLPVDRLQALRAVRGVTIKSFEVGYQYMMFHNMRGTSVLSDARVRRAVDLVIDRQALAQELRGGFPTRSLFPKDSPYHRTDTAGTHADRTAAEDLLDSAGWVLDPMIKRRVRNGTVLSLSLVSYPFRPGLGIMAPLIRSSLRSLGIDTSWGDLDLWAPPHSAVLADRTYDLLMWAQHTLPNGDPQWFLNAFFRGDPMDSQNYAGINSSAIDGLLDALSLAGHAGNARINAALAAHEEILGEVAVSNLVTPQWHIGVSDRLAEYVPWGADYYVLRSDFHQTGATTSTTPATTTTPSGEVSGATRAVMGGLSLVGLWLAA